jgi:SAM-dependent methyltransferase
MRPATPRQQKVAAAYDSDIWPLVPARAAELMLRMLPRPAAARVLELGCATGHLTLAVAERLDADSRILAVDASAPLIAQAEARKVGHPAADKVSFQVFDPATPPPAGAHDLVLANLTVGEAAQPAIAVGELVRALKPGGRVVLTLTLSGSWAEFLDLYGDVLTEQGKRAGLAALARHRASVPAAETAVAWLEGAGLTDVGVEVNRFELLFKSAREFFFAPIVELGPLPMWKQIAGGHGDEMQDVFFFIKEAIETYFSGTVFPVSMVVGCLSGTKPAAIARDGGRKSRSRPVVGAP